MPSAENDEAYRGNANRDTTQSYERQCSPPPEDEAPRSLVPISNQETDIAPYDAQPEVFVLLPPPDHELPDSTLTTLNQETVLVPWTESREPIFNHVAPPSSLPVRRYTSPRENNSAAQLPTTMAHRAHTPLPQFANARLPDATPMLTEFQRHGITTYATESTAQVELDPNDPDDRDVLSYTDKVPMAGKYLQTADYREGMRAREDMLEEYGPHDVLDAQNAATRFAEELSVATASRNGDTVWDSSGAEVVAFKAAQGVTTYWRAQSLKRRAQSEQGDEQPAKKQKKQHRRFTEPAYEYDEGVQSYLKALEGEESKAISKSLRDDATQPEAMEMDMQPPKSPRPHSQSLELTPTAAAALASTSSILSNRAGAATPSYSSQPVFSDKALRDRLLMPPPPRPIPHYRPPPLPTPTKRSEIIAWKISPCYRCLSYLSADWDAKIEAFWQANDDEESFFGLVYHRDPRPTPTYIPHVWGCELEENRSFGFWVSDYRDLGAEEPFRPRYVDGEKLGAEWDGALARFWRERERVEAMKRVSGEMERSGLGALGWLERQDASGRELDGDGKGDEDEDEDRDWYCLGESPEEGEDAAKAGKKRRDSGGSK
ncbi:hypothetical protein Q7P35_005879 [Cladosporium inversicolor]